VCPQSKENKENGSNAEEEEENDETVDEENEEKVEKEDNSKSNSDDKNKNTMTVTPELLSAMVKALQEALVNTNTGRTTSTQKAEFVSDSLTEEPKTVSKSSIDTDSAEEEELSSTVRPKTKTSGIDTNTVTTNQKTRSKSKPISSKTRPTIITTTKRKLIPTIISAIVTNTTLLRLKSPVLSVLSGTSPSYSQTTPFPRTSSLRPPDQISQEDISDEQEQEVEQEVDEENVTQKTRIASVPTNEDFSSSLPFIATGFVRNIKNNLIKSSNNNNNINDKSMATIMSNFNIDDLTDDERKNMLSNILNAINAKSDSINSKKSDSLIEREDKSEPKRTQTSNKNNKKSEEKSPNLHIVSSIDELSSAPHDPNNPPIFVVLLPENPNEK
jgi:hypothetical protein